MRDLFIPKILLGLLVSGVLFGQTSKYRVLYPPHSTMKGVSAGVRSLGGANGSNNLFPVVGGNGWTVDMGKGALSMVVPVATVPGEIPIPLVFRFNATNAWPVVGTRSYIWLGSSSTTQTAVASPLIGTGGMYAPGYTHYARPIFGTVDFGFISSNDTQSVPGTDVYVAGKLDKFTPNPYYVLEDGTVHSALDFITMTGTFSLPPTFGFAAKAASAVTINSSGTLVAYPAVASDLGSWATKAAAYAPVGFTTGTHTGYKVVMDRDRARVYAYATELYAWIPILWVDRFGHWVGFQWKNITTGLPSGIGAVRTVTALNHLGKGVQVQWAEPTAGGAGVQGDYLRADFINIQAPTLQVTAYPDLQTVEEAMLPLAGGAVLRPTMLRIGNPSMPLPNLNWAQLPVPQQVSNPWSWPASDLYWNFGYNVNSSSGASELTNFTDSLGLTTNLTWQDTYLLDPTAAQSSTIMLDNYRSVATAVSTDSGVTLKRTFTWNLPSTTSATAWSNTYNQQWSGTQSWNSQAVLSADNPTVTYNFAIPSNSNYGNGSATQISIVGSSAQSVSQYGYSVGYGDDGTLTGLQTVSTTTTGAPSLSIITNLDTKTGSPITRTTCKGAQSPSPYQDVVTNGYDRHPEFLDPNRCTTVSETRGSKTVSSYPNSPQKTYTYDATTFLPTQTCLGTLSAGIGTSYTYFQSGDNRYGHPQSSSPFAAGPLFVNSGGKTQSFVLDATTALTISTTTTYDGPTVSGCANSFTQSTFTYDSGNRPKSYLDGLGATVGASYDGRGRVVGSTRTGEAPITVTYPSETEMDTTQNGRTTKVYTDAFGRPTYKFRGGDGVTEYYSYDENGRQVITTAYSPQGKSRTTSNSYDALGRPTQVIPPKGPTVSFAYSDDGAGNQVVTTTYSGQSFTSSKSTDLWGNPVSSTDPYGTVITRQYDAQGHVITLTTTPSGGTPQIRTFNYSSLGQLLSKKEPETTTTTYSGSNYNIQGLPLSIQENDSRTRTLTYDGLGRVRSVTNGTDNSIFNYNGLFLKNSSTSSAGQSSSIVYTPDAISRVQSEAITPPGAATAWTITYGYDPNVNRLTSITYPQGRKIGYNYDDVNNYGRITSITNNDAPLATVGYDQEGWGHLGLLSFASGSSNTWDYTSDGVQINNQTITPVGASQITRTYGYDSLNHLNQAGEWTSVTHDVLGRLTQATSTTMGISNTLQHDGYDNNISSLAGTASGFTNFTFNPLSSNQIPTTTPLGSITEWQYDGDGEASTMGSAVGASPQYSFVWDKLGRLSSTTLNGSTETYAYLPTGYRVQVLDSSTPSNNRRFAYSTGGRVLSEFTGAGSSWNWKGDVVYLGSQAIAEIDANGVHELHTDHCGTPIIVTTPGFSGIQATQMFGPYGESIASPYSSSGAYTPMTGYSGHVQTDATGLIYMRGRFYSPNWHRFINSDQGADSNQLNQFAYCGGSPLMRSDPSGMMCAIIDPTDPKPPMAENPAYIGYGPEGGLDDSYNEMLQANFLAAQTYTPQTDSSQSDWQQQSTDYLAQLNDAIAGNTIDTYNYSNVIDINDLNSPLLVAQANPTSSSVSLTPLGLSVNLSPGDAANLGNGLALAGGTLVLGGLALAPETGGASLPGTLVGSVIGVAGLAINWLNSYNTGVTIIITPLGPTFAYPR